MTKILVVDDVATHRQFAGALLEEHQDWQAIYAEDGRQALTLIEQDPPDLVLTDLQMPELDGLQLVKAIHKDYGHIPVILMTAHGSESIAVDALRTGAASYVPKDDLVADLVQTTEKVLEMAAVDRKRRQVLQCLVETELRFVLTNDPQRVQTLINHLQDHMIMMNLVDQGGAIRVGTALHESLINAMEHGNLEVSSELREGSDILVYRRTVDERRIQKPYCDRRVIVTARFSRNEAIFNVRDDGTGFDTTKLPDPRSSKNIQKCSGRGLFLIRTFMDEVSFNQTGNEITMIKRH